MADIKLPYCNLLSLVSAEKAEQIKLQMTLVSKQSGRLTRTLTIVPDLE